jgi:hypothetical protein
VLDEQRNTVLDSTLIPIIWHGRIASKAVQDIQIRHGNIAIGAGGDMAACRHNPDTHDGTEQSSDHHMTQLPESPCHRGTTGSQKEQDR